MSEVDAYTTSHEKCHHMIFYRCCSMRVLSPFTYSIEACVLFWIAITDVARIRSLTYWQR
jgi:hypothetical protein